jgi:hypothetical protein
MNIPCKHQVDKARYLTSHVTPHMLEPDTKSAMCCVFLCCDCGDLFTSQIEVLRGYMPDGSLPPEIAKISDQKRENQKLNMLVEARAGQLLSQRLKQIDEEAKRAGATRDPILPKEAQVTD